MKSLAVILFFASAAAAYGTQVGTGSWFSCALHDGRVQCAGFNQNGELGNGTFGKPSARPSPVCEVPVDKEASSGCKRPLEGVRSISVGASHACALKSGGEVLCWGFNGAGQLGDGTTKSRHYAVAVKELPRASFVSAGLFHSCAVASGKAYCWGDNREGELGTRTPAEQMASARAVDGLTTGVTRIAAGFHASCAIHQGRVKCWGTNRHGGLGVPVNYGNWRANPEPQTVLGLDPDVSEISTGLYSACALTRGKMQCWGYNGDGQLGDGTTRTRWKPQPVIGMSERVEALAASYLYSNCAVQSEKLFCWGYNGWGNLGDGSRKNVLLPKFVAAGVSQVAAFGHWGEKGVLSYQQHACAVSSGAPGIACFGSNTFGELGMEGITSTSTPRSSALGPDRIAVSSIGETKEREKRKTATVPDAEENFSPPTPMDFIE